MLAILDYEAGNQTSVMRGLAGQGLEAVITAEAEVLAAADGVIFPGVGAAGQAMAMLRRTGLDNALRDLLAAGKPLLGICLGCQILLDFSEEDDTPTLGLVPGRCRRFDPKLRDEDGQLLRIPHMGWNSCALKTPCRLFQGLPPEAEFYFVHSYYADPRPDLVIATTRHGLDFCSVLGRDGLWAVQFHPEKSGRAGLALLRNFHDYCLEQATC
ncbi:MAG: imidazole glycerol phosphate synthase subunit HisH [Deltaproteobacteria bacterium]|jgi:glutamine amidotransferase|nr:imidazole glycerol phosphate synthase subunit HisH [Deltaproteobacteria bacterium]